MKPVRFALGVLAAALALASAVFAQEGREEASASATGEQEAFAHDAELVADSVISSFMRQYRPAGVTLAIVKDGKPIVLKGYGVADPETDNRPIDPRKNLFRIGSISKTFTWIAVMQLVEQGKLDLDENVNSYLKAFQLPEPHGVPLTLNDIMAHRSGFEDGGAGYMLVGDPARTQILEELLRTEIPAQIYPPGTVTAYSNYASALAGHIVENVSGMAFNDYVDEFITGPLQMNHTTFREPEGAVASADGPMDPALEPDVTPGHVFAGGRPQAIGFEYIQSVGPAGSVHSTAADMARYMIALLHKGEIDGVKILRPETVEEMRKRGFSDRPEAVDFAHGFFNGKMHGYEYFGHGGGTSGFFSIMEFSPELDFGVFASVNTTVGFSQFKDIPSLIVGELFGDNPASTNEEFMLSAEEMQKFAGEYIDNRRNFRGVEAILNFFNPALKATISVSPDGLLIRRMGAEGSAWKPAGPFAFRNFSNPDEVMTFVQDDSGAIVRFNSELGHKSFERSTYFAKPDFLYLSALTSLVLTFSTFAAAFMRRRTNKGMNVSPYSALALYAGFLCIVIIVMGVSAILEIAGAGVRVTQEFPLDGTRAFLMATPVALISWTAMALSVIPVWISTNFTFWRKAHYSLLAAALAAFGIMLWNWHLVGA